MKIHLDLGILSRVEVIGILLCVAFVEWVCTSFLIASLEGFVRVQLSNKYEMKNNITGIGSDVV